jgi:hypothetical protein
VFNKVLPGRLVVATLYFPVTAAHVVPQIGAGLLVDVADKDSRLIAFGTGITGVGTLVGL